MNAKCRTDACGVTYAYDHLTHVLDLTRVGVPHLTCDQSHDATWNYLGMPHHHGVHGPVQLEMDTSTWKL
jgi:hypothetical protein